MGITRIVGGDMINTSTGMNLTATDGNFEFHAAGKNQWQGQENGIVEDNYKAKKKDDTLSNSINVNLNLFFDGTQNNKTNTEARNSNSVNHSKYQTIGNKNDDSFENDYTNVARGFDAIDPAIENQVATYIEGIGTEDLKEDSVKLGVALGTGPTGVVAKVNKGCMDAANEMKNKKYAGKDIDILYVNVYGFSRGAAAARHFLHVASKMATYEKTGKVGENKYKYNIYPEDYAFMPISYTSNTIKLNLENTAFIDKYGYFGACLLSKKMKIKEIRFNFVGIYDTVASLGLNHGDDVSELHLDSVSKARYVFHLASDDEYRENFDLSNIKSAGIRGFELTLPGVHSDIGGSYLNDVVELSVIDNYTTADNEDSRNYAKQHKDKDYDKFKEIVIEEGWFNDAQLKKEFFREIDFDKFSTWNAHQHNYGLVGRRKLFNTYDKIPLTLMIKESERFDVKYDNIIIKNNEITDGFINNVYNCMLQYFNACAQVRNKYVTEYNSHKQNSENVSSNYLEEVSLYNYKSFITPDDLKKLRNEYLHWSVKSNLLGLEARKEGPLWQEQRKREIHHG
jgi:hypothetical protein